MLEYGDGLRPSIYEAYITLYITVRLGTIRICECVLFAIYFIIGLIIIIIIIY